MVFNKPFLTGDEEKYIKEAIASGKISGNGKFTKACHLLLQEYYGYKKCLLTTSCTDALEMAAILADIEPGDEVIIPSYTFVSTANAFLLRGATIVFADSMHEHPNIDPDQIEKLVTGKTKAIVPVHYAGVACDMDAILKLAFKYNLLVIEDAAQAINAYHRGKPLGGIGHFGAISFHDTKNIIAGEGGLLLVNDERFRQRAEIVWEKGTNRSAFLRGEVDKYGWTDIGSSFLPSELTAAFLYAQLLRKNEIQSKRKHFWELYHESLLPLETKGFICLNRIPGYARHNYHIFYFVTKDGETRNQLLDYLKANDIEATFHYLQLHKSDYFLHDHDMVHLGNADKFTDCLIRLPLYADLMDDDVNRVCELVKAFFKSKTNRPGKSLSGQTGVRIHALL